MSPLPAEASSVQFLGVAFSLLETEQVESHIRQQSQAATFSFVVTPNSDHIVKLAGDQAWKHREAFRQAYDRAALRLCDSRIVRLLASLRGFRFPLTTGSDLTRNIFYGMLGSGDRVAIIGGDEALLPKLRRIFPDPDFHQHIPPMGVLSNDVALDAIAAFVASIAPNFTFFAIGAPQSEIAAMRCTETAGTTGVGLCIGASIAFLTGDLKRAPVFLQRLGLEWAFRLLSEPRRLWRRYILESPRILLLACRSHIEK